MQRSVILLLILVIVLSGCAKEKELTEGEQLQDELSQGDGPSEDEVNQWYEEAIAAANTAKKGHIEDWCTIGRAYQFRAEGRTHEGTIIDIRFHRGEEYCMAERTEGFAIDDYYFTPGNQEVWWLSYRGNELRQETHFVDGKRVS